MEKSKNEIIIYATEDNLAKVEVRMEGETVWLTNLQLSQLFDVSKSTISEHVKNIFDSGELDSDATVRKFRTVRQEGGRQVAREIEHYNLDMIISLGYRVNSLVATRFRQWATTCLHEYIQKGFTIDDERLKGEGGGDYWKELLDRIRDIRSSEKALYRQVLDLYATSIDYDPKSPETLKFFKVVQNKLHYATNQQTAAELIHSRADAEKDFMGLTTFAGAHPNLRETTIAKNYLTEDELFVLNRLVSAFFDLAEIRAKDHVPMSMHDWVQELDKFAQVYGKGILKDAGKISHKQAEDKATREYRKYQARTLSPIEEEYLDSIKKLEKTIENNINK